jgi:hypothetical protein
MLKCGRIILNCIEQQNRCLSYITRLRRSRGPVHVFLEVGKCSLPFGCHGSDDDGVAHYQTSQEFGVLPAFSSARTVAAVAASDTAMMRGLYPWYGWPGWWGPSVSFRFGYWGRW